MKPLCSLLVLILLSVMLSCKKDSATEAPTIPPYLTGKLWILDTILINAPATYNNLTPDQQFSYNAALAWSKDKAQITFMNDWSVQCSGDWDYGYTHWQLINNDNDIKVSQGSGFDTLRAWKVSDVEFSYIHSMGMESFDCTLIYK